MLIQKHEAMDEDDAEKAETEEPRTSRIDPAGETDDSPLPSI